MSIQGSAKRQTATNTPLIKAGRQALIEAGRRYQGPKGPVPGLAAFTFVHEGVTYDFCDFVTSEPMLQAGFSAKEIVPDRHLPSLVHHRNARHFTVQELQFRLRSQGAVNWGDTYRLELPKPIWSGNITAANFDDLWTCNSAVEEDPHKKRPLTIQDPYQRVAAYSLCLALGWFLQPRWNNCVMAGRSGIGTSHAISALRQAYRHTGMAYVLAADITSFFDNVPLSRCLTQLYRVTGINGNQKIFELLANVLASPREGTKGHLTALPQGSPLSPLLANLYGETLDRECLKLGPYMRYVDDIILMARSREQVAEYFTKLANQQVGHGTVLSRAKSFGYDFKRNRRFSLDNTTDEFDEPLLYLGVDIVRKGEDLDFRISERAILKLFEQARERWFSRDGGVDDRTKQWFLEHWERGARLMLGWLHHFAGFNMSPEQRQVLDRLSRVIYFDAESLGAKIEALLAQCRDPSQRQEHEEELLKNIAALWDHGAYKSNSKLSWNHIKRRILSIDEIIRRSRERLVKILNRPPDLKWHQGRRFFSTKGEDLVEKGTVPFIWDTDAVQLPDGDLAVRTGRKEELHVYVAAPADFAIVQPSEVVSAHPDPPVGPLSAPTDTNPDMTAQ